ncbi:PKD domain-containing protein [Marivirga sp.]|uniref:PKD domain-containing protein n=1 Tax=Marivirga sp. TaxID=2018662 RepID=UPI003DA7448C
MQLFNKGIFLLFTVIWLISLDLFAQSSQLTNVARASRNNGSSNNPDGYVEYLPANYNSRDDWPLLIWHHGIGQGGDGSVSALNTIANKQLMNWLKTNDVPFIILAPQDNNGYFGSGRMEAFYNWVKKAYQDKSNPSAYHISVLSASGAGLMTLIENNGVPAKEVATFTVSGALTGAGTSTIYNIVNDNGTKVWFHHGDNDNTVGYGAPLNFYRGLLDGIGGQDFSRYRYTLYAGLGHSAWNEVYDNSGRTRAKVTGSISGGNYGNYFNWTSESWYDWMLSNAKDGSQAPPVANAGNDITLFLPTNSTNLEGTGTSVGGSINSYVWSKLNGPSAFTLTNENSATASLSDLVLGIYTFRLTVTDDIGQVDTDDVIVEVSETNQSPEVSLGEDISITLPVNSATLTSVINDPDGTVIEKLWTKRSGPSANLSGTTTGTLNAANLVEGQYLFRLTVKDDDNATAYDEIEVTVNPAEVNNPPVANAGDDQTINLPTNSITVTGNGSDSDGTVSFYLWEKVQGGNATLSNTNNATLTVTELEVGIYRFKLTVTDDDGAQDSDEMELNVLEANQNPIADAGGDLSITLPTNSITITGTASDPDGSIASYSWSQEAGPNTANLNNASTAILIASDLIAGTYRFRLTVTDDEDASGSDIMEVLVNSESFNIDPDVSAGTDKNITLPVDSVELSGSASDTDGTINSYLWSKVSGPSSFNIVDSNTAITIIENLVEGFYTFKLTVTDNDNGTNSDNVIVNVLPGSVNEIPKVNAGNDKSITLPTSSLIINGSATDSDGTIITYNWSQINGPNSASLTNADTESVSISNLIEGIYNFNFEVTDNNGASASDEVKLTVNATNQAPSVFAGKDQVLSLPKDSVIIVGTATDNDGTIEITKWEQISGSQLTINSDGLSLRLNNLEEGIYSFKLTATDNDGATNSDVVNVTVNGSNILPVVNAGPDRSLKLPTNSINISGSAIDSDGSISSLIWSQDSDFNPILINQNTATLTVNDLVAGTYVFKLTATDNAGGVSSDDMELIVNSEDVNILPTVNAGEDIILYLPVNTATINGIASDNDGSIESYEWNKVSGPGVSLANTSTSSLTISDLLEGVYVFRLTVTDNIGATATDNIQLIVYPEESNQGPIANAGEDKSIVLPTDNTVIEGSASDSDGDIVSYEWAQVAGPNTATLTNQSGANLVVDNLIEGQYRFILTVEDDKGVTDEDEVLIVVLPENTNLPPFVDAGPKLDVYLPTNNVNIIGLGNDEDGEIISFLWQKLSGPSEVNLKNTDTPVLSVSNLKEGIYLFKLRVVDNDGESNSDEVQLRVFATTANKPPIVNAGPDKSIIIPRDSIVIYGQASDSDGSIESYSWLKISGGEAELIHDDKPNLKVTDLVEGNYIFRFTAFDDRGSSNSDEIKVIVLPEFSNNLPNANAGADKTVKLPLDFVELSGTAQDEDGEVIEYLWSKKRGPEVKILNGDTPNLRLEEINPGEYLFDFEVIDDQGGRANDEIILKVLPASANLNPTVDLGNDIYEYDTELPIVIESNAIDEDGTIESYTWELTNGVGIKFSGIDSNSLTISEAQKGSYNFRLSVTDNDGAISSDVIKVQIYVEKLIPAPIAIAGSDTTLILPDDDLILRGTVNSENLISSFSWEQITGPVISSLPLDSNVLKLENLSKSEYTFRLRVVDIDDQEGIDDVTVIVRDNDPSNDFPKIFSPNGDGRNDYWVVDDLERISNCSLIVYDSFGREVYRNSSYENNWDGTVNGALLPEAAYYYVFKCPGMKNINGGVRIVR